MRFIITAVLLLTFAVAVSAQDPPAPAKGNTADTWRDFTSKEGQFSVLFPGTPRESNRTLKSGIGPVNVYDFEARSDVSVYYLSYSEFPKVGPLTPEEQREMLDDTRNSALYQGGQLIGDVNVSVSGIPAKELIVAKDGYVMRARVFYANERLYNLIIGIPTNTAFMNGKPSSNAADRTELFEAISKKFFDSFKLTK